MQDACPVHTPLDANIKLEPREPEEGNWSNNYASLIGSLMYAAVATRPDIAFAVNRLASFTANPTMCHWTAAKHVLRYLKGTKNIGITYSKPESSNMTSQNNFTGYSDASFANNTFTTNTRCTSTITYYSCFDFIYNGNSTEDHASQRSCNCTQVHIIATKGASTSF